MKTLKTIQIISKIGKILSKILFIFCIIGAAGCIAGIISLACIPDGIKIGGMTIQGLIEKNAEMSVGAMYAPMATGIILCAGGAVLCKFAETYFKNELEAGTPFTFDGAKELIRLGILNICIPLGTVIIAAIIYAIFAKIFGGAAEMDIKGSASAGLGVMLIITGLICRHGAEVSQNNENEEKQD